MNAAHLTASRSSFAVAVLFFVVASPARADFLTVAWDPNVEQIGGYAVYSGTQPGSLPQRYDVGDTTTFTLSNAVAGQQYCFAVAAYLDPSVEGPRSNEVCGFSNQPPTLVGPGDRTSNVGESVTLQLQGSDPEQQPLSYSATGLPPGITVMASTGYISGAGTTGGTYSVEARASDGVLSASQSFSWVMVASPTLDITPPLITITTPTSSTSYVSSGATVQIAGTASDTTSVSQVTWVNDRGGNGTAVGTTSWSTASIGLQGGTNVITLTAHDAAGNTNIDTLTVTYTPPDTLAPAVSIVTPTQAPAYSVAIDEVSLDGTAADDRGVTAVTWANDRGGTGFSEGTSGWRVPSVRLQAGTNVISVTAQDAAGNRGVDVLTVDYVPPPTPSPEPSIVLTATASSRKQWTRVFLRWNVVPGSSVDVYRNGVRITNTSNDGSYTDSTRNRLPLSYHLCVSGTTVCSNTIVVGG